PKHSHLGNSSATTALHSGSSESRLCCEHNRRAESGKRPLASHALPCGASRCSTKERTCLRNRFWCGRKSSDMLTIRRQRLLYGIDHVLDRAQLPEITLTELHTKSVFDGEDALDAGQRINPQFG